MSKAEDLAVVGGGASAALGGFRNKIIGGDFTTNPWQRGTSFTGLASGSYGADRFVVGNTSDGVVDMLKTADAPTATQAGIYSSHCLHLDVTTADASITATQSYFFSQRLEGYSVACLGLGQAGTRYITLSFWHKHTKTGTYCVAFRNSASDRAYVAEYAQSVTDTWEKAVITIPVDVTGTWLYDNGIGLQMSFILAAGTDRHTTANAWAAGFFLATANQVNALDSTANNFKIALVQLEAGSVATPFETRSIGEEKGLCRRYGRKMASEPLGPALSPSNLYSGVMALGDSGMRATPTLDAGATYSASGGNAGTPSINTATPENVMFSNSAANWTATAFITITGFLNAEL